MPRKKGIFLSAVLMLLLLVATISCAQPSPAPAPAATSAPVITAAPAPKPASSPAPAPTSAPAPAPASKPAATTPQYGGILKIINQPGILNMGVPGEAFASGDMNPARCVVQSLVDIDAKGNIVPCLATSWQYSPDYKSLTFTLRKGVVFHDGTDFNAEAVKYCLDMARKTRADMDKVTSIDVVDNYTVRLNLSVYEPKLLICLANNNTGKIVSPTALKTMGTECRTHPVGTGPFEYVSYQRDVSLKFKKFIGYWEQGKPYLDGIEYVFIADAVTRLASFKAGEGKALGSVDPKDAADLKATGNYVINKTPSGVMGLAGDSAHPTSPFADIKVRQAIAYAIDNAAIAKAIGYGIYEATNQFSAPGHSSYNTAIVGYPYNPQKAKELLTAAGYPKGFATKITCTQSNTNVYTAMQGYLNEVGINATMDIAEPGRWVQVQTGGWNNQLVSYDISHSDGLDKGDSLEKRMSNKSQFYPTHTFYVPADCQAKLDQANIERDTQKRNMMFQELMKMITDQYCLAIPVYVGYGAAAVKSPEVHDMNMNVIAGHIWHPANAWLSK